jgi:hypothetical protein
VQLPAPGTESREWSGVDPLLDRWTLGSLTVFVLGLGAIVGAVFVLSQVARGGLLGRLATLGLVSVPLWTFPIAARAVEADTSVATVGNARPGVVETWAVLVVGATAGATVYGPLVGLAATPLLAAQAALGLSSYVFAPLWLGTRFLASGDASDVATLTMVLSVLTVLVGAGSLLAVVGPSMANSRLLAMVGTPLAIAGAAGVTRS